MPQTSNKARALSLLKNKKLTISEAARELGVTRQAVSAWNKEAGGVAVKRGRSAVVVSRKIIDVEISHRIEQPGPDQVRETREKAGLSQSQSINLVSPAGRYQTWLEYELPEDNKHHRPIPLPLWELFLLLTDQHPLFELKLRKKKA